MHRFLLCLSAVALVMPAHVAGAQSAPVDSLTAFLDGGAATWQATVEPDMVAISRREATARTRDDAMFTDQAAIGRAAQPAPRRPANPAPIVSASVGQASASPVMPVVAPPVRERARAATPARATAAPRIKRTFINPWQTGVFQ